VIVVEIQGHPPVIFMVCINLIRGPSWFSGSGIHGIRGPSWFSGSGIHGIRHLR
jgi:hypothetical protein